MDEGFCEEGGVVMRKVIVLLVGMGVVLVCGGTMWGGMGKVAVPYKPREGERMAYEVKVVSEREGRMKGKKSDEMSIEFVAKLELEVEKVGRNEVDVRIGKIDVEIGRVKVDVGIIGVKGERVGGKEEFRGVRVKLDGVGRVKEVEGLEVRKGGQEMEVEKLLRYLVIPGLFIPREDRMMSGKGMWDPRMSTGIDENGRPVEEKRVCYTTPVYDFYEMKYRVVGRGGGVVKVEVGDEAEVKHDDITLKMYKEHNVSGMVLYRRVRREKEMKCEMEERGGWVVRMKYRSVWRYESEEGDVVRREDRVEMKGKRVK